MRRTHRFEEVHHRFANIDRSQGVRGDDGGDKEHPKRRRKVLDEKFRQKYLGRSPKRLHRHTRHAA